MVIPKEWFVYLLECNDGSYYTGITNDVQARMKKHESGAGSRYVNSRGFKKLLFSKKCNSKSQASKYEYEIKSFEKEEKIRWFAKNS